MAFDLYISLSGCNKVVLRYLHSTATLTERSERIQTVFCYVALIISGQTLSDLPRRSESLNHSCVVWDLCSVTVQLEDKPSAQRLSKVLSALGQCLIVDISGLEVFLSCDLFSTA